MELTNIENDHQLFMSNIVKSLTNTPYVLKGGTALMFGYGLDRFSEDLDFDSTKKLNLDTKIKENLPFGFEIVDINKPKDTNTVQRYKVSYTTPNGKRRLKIETSYRNKEIDTNDYSLIDGMQIYNIDRKASDELNSDNNLIGRDAPIEPELDLSVTEKPKETTFTKASFIIPKIFCC